MNNDVEITKLAEGYEVYVHAAGIRYYAELSGSSLRTPRKARPGYILPPNSVNLSFGPHHRDIIATLRVGQSYIARTK